MFPVITETPWAAAVDEHSSFYIFFPSKVSIDGGLCCRTGSPVHPAGAGKPTLAGLQPLTPGAQESATARFCCAQPFRCLEEESCRSLRGSNQASAQSQKYEQKGERKQTNVIQQDRG